MILIVDDIKENIFALKRTLEINGFKVDTALSGEEALKKVLKNVYTLIILDVQMPVMDGFEVAELLTSSNRTKDTPVIFLSAVSIDKRLITKGYNSGAVDYLIKPVDTDVLMLKVKVFNNLSEKTTALKNAENELTQKNLQLNTMLEALPQIAFMASGHGAIDYVNQLWYQYSNNKNSFPVTRQGTPTVEGILIKNIQKQIAFEQEVELQDIKSSGFKYFLLKVTPINVSGYIVNWVGTFTDISVQKNANEVLEKRVDERTEELQSKNTLLEQSNYELQQFAAVASHDLKEPLRKIQLFSNIITEKNLSADEELNGYITKIGNSVQRMIRLINDLLQYSRLSADASFEMVDLNKIIDEVISDLELTIVERNAVITKDKLPQLQAIPGQMRQVFQNIISNSIKFTHKSRNPEIKIHCDIVDTYNDGKHILTKGPYCKITVSDNGIGFDEAFVDKIFVLFQRLASNTEYEGTGIGLAVTKKIVDRHSGAISATSVPGQGSDFVIVLPLTH